MRPPLAAGPHRLSGPAEHLRLSSGRAGRWPGFARSTWPPRRGLATGPRNWNRCSTTPSTAPSIAAASGTKRLVVRPVQGHPSGPAPRPAVGEGQRGQDLRTQGAVEAGAAGRGGDRGPHDGRAVPRRREGEPPPSVQGPRQPLPGLCPSQARRQVEFPYSSGASYDRSHLSQE